MTEAVERLSAARLRLEEATKAIEEHFGHAAVVGSGEPEQRGSILDKGWGAETDRLERELYDAIGELIRAGREILGERAARQP